MYIGWERENEMTKVYSFSMLCSDLAAEPWPYSVASCSNEVFIHTSKVTTSNLPKKDHLLPWSHTAYYTLITVQVKSSADLPLTFMSLEAADDKCYHITNDCFLHLMLFSLSLNRLNIFNNFFLLTNVATFVILPITHFSDKLRQQPVCLSACSHDCIFPQTQLQSRWNIDALRMMWTILTLLFVKCHEPLADLHMKVISFIRHM